MRCHCDSIRKNLLFCETLLIVFTLSLPADHAGHSGKRRNIPRGRNNATTAVNSERLPALCSVA